MDIKRVDLLLKYILAAAGQEDLGQREVGPTHLVKYVYLADPAFTEKLFFEIKNKQAPKPILNCLVEERDANTKEKRATFFKSLQAPDLKVFSTRERKIIENVAFIFREATAKDMTEITHLKNEPWNRTLKSKGEKKKIDWFLALDAEAKIDRESAEERLQQSEEMKELFGNG